MNNMVMNEVQAECHQIYEEGMVEDVPSVEQLEAIRLNIVKEQCLKERNLRDLAALQDIIAAEEGEALSTQQVLGRVLGFYNRYVPFMQ
jgi:hypothetical protein